MIEKIHPFMLAIHIAAGTIALLIVPLIMLLTKGDKRHRRLGNTYQYAMLVVVITAIIMSVYHRIPFLFMISVFSYVAVIKGIRNLRWEKLKAVPGIPRTDWIISISSLVFSSGMLLYGALVYSKSRELALLCFFFGSFGTIGEIRALRNFMLKPEMLKRDWLKGHISLMLGSYIATTTAFLVNTAVFLPDLVRWFGPSLIGVPLIGFAVRYYSGKGKKRELAG